MVWSAGHSITLICFGHRPIAIVAVSPSKVDMEQIAICLVTINNVCMTVPVFLFYIIRRVKYWSSLYKIADNHIFPCTLGIVILLNIRTTRHANLVLEYILHIIYISSRASTIGKPSTGSHQHTQTRHCSITGRRSTSVSHLFPFKRRTFLDNDSSNWCITIAISGGIIL